jgi:hypothetical protein
MSVCPRPWCSGVVCCQDIFRVPICTAAAQWGHNDTQPPGIWSICLADQPEVSIAHTASLSLPEAKRPILQLGQQSTKFNPGVSLSNAVLVRRSSTSKYGAGQSRQLEVCGGLTTYITTTHGQYGSKYGKLVLSALFLPPAWV